MTERSLRLLLIDEDSLFRLGLRTYLAGFSDLQVVAETGTGQESLAILQSWVKGEASEPIAQPEEPAPTDASIDLVILDLYLGQIHPGHMTGLELCQVLKIEYPQLPVLLISVPGGVEPQLSESLTTAFQMGINGYCPKGTLASELVAAIRHVAAGQPYWVDQAGSVNASITHASATPSTAGVIKQLRQTLHQSGVGQIEAALDYVNRQLQQPQRSWLDRAIVAGHRRELMASRWLLDRLLLGGNKPQRYRTAKPLPSSQLPTIPQSRSTLLSFNPTSALGSTGNHPSLSPLSPRDLQSLLFDAIVANLESGLQNLTQTPLEIDILKTEKKRELLYIVLRKIEDLLIELRFSQMQLSQLLEKRSIILQDLWQIVMTDFFGKYATLSMGENQLEIVDLLIQDRAIVEAGILSKIPLFPELLAHLLFQSPLEIDSFSYAAGSPEAIVRSELLVQNVLIQVANAVIQPLLNRLGNVEAIKQNFYDRRLLSTREIERFRNNLSWKYRLETAVKEPQAIFESRFQLFIITELGIKKTSIYAPREQELAQLSGIPYTITLALEIRDAIAPRLRSAVSLLGSGLIYLLTEVLGRSIGLIGRGILKGVGNAWQDRSKN